MDNSDMMLNNAMQLADDANRIAEQAIMMANNGGVDMATGGFWMLMTIFILACFVGYFVVWRVTPALHSPLMSVSNAISGVVIVGAILVAGVSFENEISKWLGFAAVVLASINIFGGFVVSQRMLAMFKKKEKKNS